MPDDERQDRAPRVQLAIAATLVDSDGGALPVVIKDLSGEGLSLEAGEELIVSEQVRLRVSRYGDFPAAILWVDGYRAGGRFLEPVRFST